VVAGAALRIEEDLRWLGLTWDGEPVHQSRRGAAYEGAIARLTAQGLVYPCDCSRAEIARVASAPHPGDEVVYPGFCRDRDPGRAMRRPPALRVRVPDEPVEVVDAIAGHVSQRLAREIGDFVLRRGDGVYAYQLAVVVDDLDQAITHVVRGADLLASAPRQAWLARALGGTPPQYLHVPMVLGPDGARLEKRTRGVTVRELRGQGVTPERILGALAHGLGLTTDDAPATAPALARACAGRPLTWRTAGWRAPLGWPQR
jgi:glutamyl-tRNA synthetase